MLLRFYIAFVDLLILSFDSDQSFLLNAVSGKQSWFRTGRFRNLFSRTAERDPSNIPLIRIVFRYPEISLPTVYLAGDDYLEQV